MLSSGLSSAETLCVHFLSAPSELWWGWKPAQARNGSQESCRRWDTGPDHPAQFVKPYVKSHKNDTIDAAAIAEAVTRPTMRFVQVKQPEQVDLQSLHRIRDQMVGSRTRLICQMRAFCLEYGVAIRQGAGLFKSDLPRVIADECTT
jgi:hypothetical protein